MIRRPRLAAAILALPLAMLPAACGEAEPTPPGEVSPGEAKALDDAASMLDERRLPPETLATDTPPESAPASSPADLTGDAADARR